MTDNHKGPLRPEGGDVLQAALADPFSVPNLPRISPFQPTNPATRSGTSRALRAPAPTSPESSVSPAEFEAWKAEYESQVAEWRRQSATARAPRRGVRGGRSAGGTGGRAAAARYACVQASVELGGTSTSTSEWEAVSHRSTLPPSDGRPTPAPPARGGSVEGVHH
ncbi:hypothetical protein EDB84DRAFT_1210834 [Lactarius hengduanensis]|nr:hypothetical protein EDB84DRAFT_1210834 [Lactarius hengduanensis]